MGVCQARKQKLQNGDIQIIEQPKCEKKVSYNQLLLEQYHKLSNLLELIGNTDDLDKNTRESLNLLFISRSNVSILVQYEIKKIMKQKNIVKKVTIEDEILLYEDTLFLHRAGAQFQVMIKALENLKDDPNFENAFPILSYSFFQMNDDLKRLTVQFISDTKTRNTTI